MLRANLDEADDRAARHRAAMLALERDQVFAVQGWAPSVRAAALREFADERRLALTIEGPGPQDVPPTLLDNPPALRGGEGLVESFWRPAHRLWNPPKPGFFPSPAFLPMTSPAVGIAGSLGAFLLPFCAAMGGPAR